MNADALGVSSAGQIADSPMSSTHDLAPNSTRELTEGTLPILQSNGNTMSSRKMSVSVAVDPVALITTECITITSAMRKHPRWAHASVSTILGGSSSPLNPSLQNSRPSTPRDDLGNRKGHKRRPLGLADGDDEGLTNRWGLRGKKGKSIQDNPLMAGFGRLRRELVGCKGTAGLSCKATKLTMLKIYIHSIRLHSCILSFR